MRQEIYQLIKSKYLWLSTAAMTICLFLSIAGHQKDGTYVSTAEYLLTPNRENAFTGAVSSTELIQNISSQILPLLAPVIGGFSTVALFCDKYDSGFIRFSLPRAGKIRLALFELTKSVLASFIIVFVSFLIYFEALLLVLPGSDESLIFTSLQKEMLLFSFVLSGNLWCLICACIADNKYFALFTPMFIFYLMQSIAKSLIFSRLQGEAGYEKIEYLALIDPYSLVNLNTNLLPIGVNIFYYLLMIILPAVAAYFLIIRKEEREV